MVGNRIHQVKLNMPRSKPWTDGSPQIRYDRFELVLGARPGLHDDRGLNCTLKLASRLALSHILYPPIRVRVRVRVMIRVRVRLGSA